MAIKATFEANFDQFVGEAKKAADALVGVESSAKTVGAAVLTALASTEIRRFAGDVRTAATEFIGAFAEEEAATKKLSVALQAQGTLTPALMAQYTALASELQKTTVNSDDLVLSMQAMLVQVGGVLPDQMAAALQAATNLSAGLGISLENATMLVAKAFGQGGEQLGKLKALLGDTVRPGADMAEVLTAINAKFGGQAVAQMETYTGRMAALNNQMSEIKERVGELLLNALTPLFEMFSSLPEPLQTFIVGVAAVGTALAPLALSFTALTTVITPLIPLISAALTGAFTALLPFLGPAGLIAVAVIAVVTAWKKWDQITAIVEGVYNAVKTWLVDRFQSVMATIKGYIDTIIGWWNTMLATVGGAVSLGTAAVAGVVQGRATGGPVTGGVSYLVGERGPELYTPAANGFITPNGGGGTSIVVHVDARESFYDTPGSVQRLGDKVGAAVLATLRTRGAVAG